MFLPWPLPPYWFACYALGTDSVLEYWNESFLPISLKQSQTDTIESSREKNSIQPSSCTSFVSALRGGLQFAVDMHSIPGTKAQEPLFQCSWFDIDMVVWWRQRQKLSSTSIVLSLQINPPCPPMIVSCRGFLWDCCYFRSSSTWESLVLVLVRTDAISLQSNGHSAESCGWAFIWWVAWRVLWSPQSSGKEGASLELWLSSLSQPSHWAQHQLCWIIRPMHQPCLTFTVC